MDWKAKPRLRYRPDAGWFAGGLVGCTAAASAGAIVVLKTWNDGGPRWLVVACAIVVALAILVAVRMIWVGIRADGDRLIVNGIWWSRRVPRGQVQSIDTEAAYPSVRWRTRGGIRMRTPLTMMWSTRTYYAAPDVRARNREYLRRLQNWAITPSTKV